MPRKKSKSISGPKALIPVRALDFAMYNTKDIRKTRGFYQKLFGFKRGEEWNDWWSEFATEPLTLCLNGTEHERNPEWDWSGPACIALAVDDVPAAIEQCRKNKVKVLIPPTETRVCWMAWTPTRMATAFAYTPAKTAARADSGCHRRFAASEQHQAQKHDRQNRRQQRHAAQRIQTGRRLDRR